MNTAKEPRFYTLRQALEALEALQVEIEALRAEVERSGPEGERHAT